MTVGEAVSDGARHSVLPKKVMLAVTLVAALVLAMLVPIGSAGATAGVDNITFCHATDSAENPYVVITTDPASIVRRGHTSHAHQGPTFTPGVHTQENRGWGDVIPPFSFVDADGDTVSFAGTTNTTWSTPPPTDVSALCTGDTVTPEGSILVEKTATGSYARGVTWGLDKTVDGLAARTFSGNPGDSWLATWEVDADKTAVSSNYLVTGTIDITYTTNVELDFELDDVLNDTAGTVADVTCPTSVIPEGSDVIQCTYTASPTDASATLNTATLNLVDPPANFTLEPGSALAGTAPVSFAETLTGDDSVTLADPRQTYSQAISADSAPTFPETFSCPTSRSAYDSARLYSQTFTNTATLTGATTNDSASATVTVNCEWELTFAGDSVTGAGLRWGGTKGSPTTWFQYTNRTSGTWNLVQGSKLVDVGDVTITPNGDGTTTLGFVMATGWELKDVAGNVKVEPLAAQPTRYKQPGAFSRHFTMAGSTFSVTVPTAAYGYAIHLDAGRWVEATY